ncbi:MAG: (d)CMP kinase [Bacteroidetes bacterium]|nr:(d)CMP kinase [Bacteroidota bacterium]
MQRNDKKKITIAIDGPAASGKSTTAKLVAGKLGYLHIDTGAMYRALTLKVIENNLDPSDEAKVVALARACNIRLEGENSTTKVLLDGVNITDRIRTPDVNKAVSTVSSYRGVRDVMVREQQRISAGGGVVLEGRDIGTVVLPFADLKIFMVASVEERVRRRKKDLALSGIDADEAELVKEIEARDRKDSTRDISPLKKASDAVELDTSDLTIGEQVDFIAALAKKKISEKEMVV